MWGGLGFFGGVISFSGSPDLGSCLCPDNHLALLPVLLISNHML